MNKNWLALSLKLTVALALFSSVSILHAQSENEGNIATGKEKVASCTGCHGENGNSLVSMYPKLADQHESYLLLQLQNFKSGVRNNPVMAPMAMALSDADMADIAAYYADQKITANPAPTLPPDDEDDTAAASTPKVTMPALLAKGGNLYRNGNLVTEVSACIACHGPRGEGNRPAKFPALYSQHADYLMKSLNDFKSGARSNNTENMMHMIAKKMSDAEIKAVSYYISTLK